VRFSDLGEIAIAWYRAANPTVEQQEIALERLTVCDTCEYKTAVPSRNSYKCGACGCPLHKKIFSPVVGPAACPKAKWSR